MSHTSRVATHTFVVKTVNSLWNAPIGVIRSEYFYGNVLHCKYCKISVSVKYVKYVT